MCEKQAVQGEHHWLYPGVTSVTLGSVSGGLTASEGLTYRIGDSFCGFWVSGSAGTKVHRKTELRGRPELGYLACG